MHFNECSVQRNINGQNQKNSFFFMYFVMDVCNAIEVWLDVR